MDLEHYASCIAGLVLWAVIVAAEAPARVPP
jgi:hypothetical protein